MFKSSKRGAGKRNAIVSLLLVAALVITGALAYLTAKDNAENKFTVGNVNITLTEPKWDKANPDGTLENIVAGQVITKDPTITNTGVNNAYVYFQVEIPKVYKTDIVGADDTVTKMTDYPLFTMQTKNGDTATDLVAFDAEGKPYSTNDDFVIVDSFIDDALTYAYDYYLFAYVGETEPQDTVKLFDQIQFANITDKFENLANGTIDDEGNTTFPAITNLQVNVKAYAIQSDFYNNEAGEEKSAANAWSLYVNQNNWKWEPVNYEGISTIEYVNEDNQVVYTESGYAGTPVTMYFEPSLAKTGYTFDWVNEDTGDVAYSGMPMPATDTTLTASYTETGYGEETSDFVEYDIFLTTNTAIEDSYFYVSGIRTDIERPTEATTVIVANSLKATFTLKEGTSETYLISFSNGQQTEASLPDYGDSEDGKTYEFPVLKVAAGAFMDNNDDELVKKLVLPDSVEEIGTAAFWKTLTWSSDSAPNTTLEEIVIPYGLKTLKNAALSHCVSLKSIVLPNSVTEIYRGAFQENTGLISVVLPNSLTSIPEKAFYKCSSLTSINLSDSITTIGARAFMMCEALTEIDLPENLLVINEYAFADCDNLTNIFIPNYVTEIAEKAFRSCDNLLSASIPSTCTVASDAFPTKDIIRYR